MREIIERYLRDHNINYSISDKGYIITFKYNRLRFCLTTDPQDPHFIRLLLPQIANIPSTPESSFSEKINEYNKKYKCVKIITEGNSIWLSIEHYFYSKEKENVVVLFERLINILEFARKDIREDLKNTKEKHIK